MAKEHYIKTLSKIRPINDLFKDHGILYARGEDMAVVRLDCCVSKLTGEISVTHAFRNRG